MVRAQRDQFLARVAVNCNVCREHYRLVLRLPEFPPTRPGQFIQIACADVGGVDQDACEIEWSSNHQPKLRGSELNEPTAMLRRPFSLAGRRDSSDGIELDIIHRVVGIGTKWLSELRKGDSLSILGPLGNAFTLPRTDQRAILVGGGVGIPPMLYLASALGAVKTVALVGAVTRDLLPLTVVGSPSAFATPQADIKEFTQYGVDSIVATDDGSLGFTGYVTQALERYLDTLSTQHSGLSTIIYTCGPELMMKRVATIAAQRNIECQIAVERAMACGMGTCQSCCIRVKKPDPSQPPLAGSDWCWRLACTDGPIFHGNELLW